VADLSITDIAADTGLGFFSPYTDISNSTDTNHRVCKISVYLETNRNLFSLFVSSVDTIPFSLFVDYFVISTVPFPFSSTTLVLPAFANATDGLATRLDYYGQQLKRSSVGLCLRVELLLERLMSRNPSTFLSQKRTSETLLWILTRQLIQSSNTLSSTSDNNMESGWIATQLGLDSSLALPLILPLLLIAMQLAPIQDVSLLTLLQPTQASIHR
jgi:hypothetical protein